MSKTIKLKKLSKTDSIIEYVKSNRKESREEELMNLSGFTSSHKVFKSKKAYSRKSKYKNSPLI